MSNQIVRPERAALDLAEMESFESRIDAIFPKEYRRFLISCNGGQAIRESVRFDGFKLGIGGATINFFYGFGGFSENIEESYFILKYDLPEILVPIANTPGGNYFLMSLRNDVSFGKIYYCDHEFEYEIDEIFDELNGVYPACLVKVADSFPMLIESMIEL